MAVFRYINMPKLVAHYLKEFSMRADGQTPSLLYKFVWCLCLPFLSAEFRRARMIALALASCTDSLLQIIGVIEAITGVNMYKVPLGEELYAGFSESNDDPYISYDNTDDAPKILFTLQENVVVFFVELNGVDKNEVLRYFNVVCPFYVNASFVWQD